MEGVGGIEEECNVGVNCKLPWQARVLSSKARAPYMVMMEVAGKLLAFLCL